MVPNEKEMTSTSGLVVVFGFKQPFFTILGLLPGLLLAKKKKNLSLVSHGRDSIRLSRYVSQSDYVVLLAMAAALWRRRPSLVMYECGTL